VHVNLEDLEETGKKLEELTKFVEASQNVELVLFAKDHMRTLCKLALHQAESFLTRDDIHQLEAKHYNDVLDVLQDMSYSVLKEDKNHVEP
jgi:galactose-1-phosphate uridylyltransferase